MNNNFTIGDLVSVLDDAIDGEVIAIQANQITVKTTDDFVLNFNASELIKINKDQKLENLFSSKSLSEVLHEKTLPPKRSFVKEKKSSKEEFVLEVDLHIDKLIKNTKGLSNFDMLNIQMDTVKRQVEFAISKRMPKLVLIHGVGEGVLKSEIDFFLSRYDQIRFHEADFKKYGFGATEVYIKQNSNR